MEVVAEKDEAVKKSERIIVKQTNFESKNLNQKRRKRSRKKYLCHLQDDGESTTIVNDSETVLKTSSLDFPVTPAEYS